MYLWSYVDHSLIEEILMYVADCILKPNVIVSMFIHSFNKYLNPYSELGYETTTVNETKSPCTL